MTALIEPPAGVAESLAAVAWIRRYVDDVRASHAAWTIGPPPPCPPPPRRPYGPLRRRQRVR